MKRERLLSESENTDRGTEVILWEEKESIKCGVRPWRDEAWPSFNRLPSCIAVAIMDDPLTKPHKTSWRVYVAVIFACK